MGQFKRDKSRSCPECSSSMEWVRGPTGAIWAMLVLERDGIKKYFGLLECQGLKNCGLTQIRRFRTEAKKY